MRHYRSFYRMSSGRRRAADPSDTVALLLLVVATLGVAFCFSVTALRAHERVDREGIFIDSVKMRDEVLAATAGYNGVYGVYVKVLETGEEFRLNDSSYSAGSCYKLPLALMIYEMAASGKIDLGSRVTVCEQDWESGTGVLRYSEPGTSLSVREMVELTITESDNVAANALLRFVGKERFVGFQRAAGARVVPVTENVSSPSDLGLFAERLVAFGTEHPALGRELLSLLVNNRFKDRLACGLPTDVQVANKIGTWQDSVNDVALVAGEKVSYIISVMSREVRPTTESGARALQQISLAVHHHIMSRVSPDAETVGLARKAMGLAGDR